MGECAFVSCVFFVKNRLIRDDASPVLKALRCVRKDLRMSVSREHLRV
jgi:hypothetical protein